MNDNFTIDQFTHRISDLPDQPTLSPQELKQRFDSSPEELRTAHNALAKCVQGITDATYPDTVTRDMLAPAVREEIAGKAEETDLAAEQTARLTLSGRVAAVEQALPQKCEVYFGTYTGTGTYPRTVSLGFTPKAVLIGHQNGLIAESTAVYSTLMLKDYATQYCGIVSNGFTLYNYTYSQLNYDGAKFFFIAFR